jgi:hypothetical protein
VTTTGQQAPLRKRARIGIVDDHPTVLLGTMGILRAHSDLQVVAAVETGAMERYGNRRQRVGRLVSAWNQGPGCMDEPDGEPDDPLIDATAEPRRRPRTRLSDEEVDAMRTGRAQGVGVNALARRFGVHRGTVWAKTRPA